LLETLRCFWNKNFLDLATVAECKAVLTHILSHNYGIKD